MHHQYWLPVALLLSTSLACSRTDTEQQATESSPGAVATDSAASRVEELVNEGEAAAPKLLSMLQSSSETDRRSAAEAAGRIGIANQPIIDELGKLLQDANSPELKETAAKAFGQLGADAVPHLVKSLTNSQSAGLAKSITSALENLDVPSNQIVELLLARERLEEAKDGIFRSGASPGGMTTTINRTNAAGEVLSSRQVGPSSPSINDLADNMTIRSGGGQATAALAEQWDEAIGSLDKTLAKLGIQDQAARLVRLSAWAREQIGFDPTTWEELLELAGNASAVSAVAFSEDGFLVASADQEGTVRLGRTYDGKVLHTFSKAHEGPVTALAISPRGDLIASGGTDKTVQLWDTVSGESRTLPIQPTSRTKAPEVASLLFLNDGDLVVAACMDDRLRIWSLTGEQPAMEHRISSGLRFAAFGDGGPFLGSLHNTGRSTEEGKVARVTNAGLQPVPCKVSFLKPFAIDATGKFLATRDSRHGFSYLSIVDLAGGGEALHEINLRDELLSDQGSSTSCLAFRRDGEILADGMTGGSVRFWSTELGRPLHSMPVSSRPVLTTMFSPDGTKLATGDGTGSVRVWGQPRGASAPNQAPEFTLAEADMANIWAGDAVVIGLNGEDPDGDSFRYEFRLDAAEDWHLGTATHVRLDNLAGGDYTVEIRAVDIHGTTSAPKSSTFTVNAWRLLHKLSGLNVAFAPKSSLLATANQHNEITLWNAVTGQPVRQLKPLSPYGPGARDLKSVPDRISGLAFNQDGTKFIAVGSWAHIWDVPNWKLVRGPRGAPRLGVYKVGRNNTQVSRPPRSPALIDDTNQLLFAAQGLQLLDVSTRAPAKAFYEDTAMTSAALSADGKTVAVMSKSHPLLRTLDLSSGKEERAQGQDAGLRNISWVTYSPKGDVILTGSFEQSYPDGGVRIWDAASLTFKQRLEGSPKNVTTLAVSPNGKTLAAGADTGAIQIWDFENLELRATLEGEGSPVHEMAFSADGLLLAAADAKSTTKVWTASEAETIAAAASSVGESPASDNLLGEREWTDSTGSNKITAEFLGVEGDTVTLKRNDGKTFKLPVSRLSQQDQRLIRQHGNSSPSGPSEAERKQSRAIMSKEREWTDRIKSTKIIATFMDLKGSIVTLKRKDGTLLKLRFSQLSQADQDLIREHHIE